MRILSFILVIIGGCLAFSGAATAWGIALIIIGVLLNIRSCLKFFLRTFETGFRADFCRFLRRIAALFYDKNGGNMPEWCHKELLKKILNSFLYTIS